MSTYKIQRGDTGHQIAKRNNISFEELQRLNPDTNWNALTVGSSIRLTEAPKQTGWQRAKNLVQSINGNPVVKTLKSAARKQINEHVIEPIFGEDSRLRLQGGVDRNIGQAYDREIIDQAKFLIEQNPEIQKAGGVKEYFKQNPDASIPLTFTDDNNLGNTVDAYNAARGKRKYGSNNNTLVDKMAETPAQYLIGQWAGNLTKDGLSITDDFNFDLTDQERKKYQQDSGWYAKARLWADKYAESSADDTALTHKLNYSLRKLK